MKRMSTFLFSLWCVGVFLDLALLLTTKHGGVFLVCAYLVANQSELAKEKP